MCYNGPMMGNIKNLLTIAGSDPSGGAGIQADLKTFSALGTYGMSVITALTAQNTMGVQAVYDLPSSFVAQQMDAIFSDIRVDALKIGMVGSPETIEMIAKAIERFRPPFVVLDPVMVATSGDRLTSDEAVQALKSRLIPLADIITPNIPEASVLFGKKVEFCKETAQELLGLGARAALLKGGHLDGAQSPDIFSEKNGIEILDAPRIETENTHGTGCTLSSALAVFLAKGYEPLPAARSAKSYVWEALRNADSLSIGKGHGPVHHFHTLWERPPH